MSLGQVKEYDANRGYGIIVDFDTKQELTVYANYLDLRQGEILTQGQKVEYDIENNRRRNWAIHVKILS